MSRRRAPHWAGGNSVPLVMQRTLLALLPVLLCMVVFLGPGILLNASALLIFCLGFEAIALQFRGRPVTPALFDGSAAITALLIALALPPLTPWWVTLTAALFAILLAKHVYGGLGQNVFNPAMVGYVTVLIAFPAEVADWPAITGAGDWSSTNATLGFFLTGALPADAVDALTGATPLDDIKTQLGQMRTMTEITARDGFGALAGRGWGWINVAALAGGLWLIRKRVITWHAPGAMLATLAGLYFMFYAIEPATNPSPVLGLLSGGTMVGAFFIVTDPVSGAASNTGRLIFGAGTGALVFGMRSWGAYPDGIAFAILFMNMLAPLIDRYTVPRVYGHRKRP